MKPMPEGYTCKTCGKFHPHPPYVYAHWDEGLEHVCINCGARHELFRGFVSLIEPGTIPKETT